MHERLLFSNVVPRSWLGRLLSALITLALVAVGAFFLFFALVAAALIAVGVLGRIWWVARKLRKQRDAGVIEGTYTVESGTPLIESDAGGRNEPPRPSA